MIKQTKYLLFFFLSLILKKMEFSSVHLTNAKEYFFIIILLKKIIETIMNDN